MAREQWNSQLGFVLAAVGSAIGLGNIWRFSYMAYQYGGGAFLVPYVVALLTAGIPLLLLEFSMGHERGGSAPLAFARIDRRFEAVGWWAVTFVMFGIVLYYTVIIAWCLNYCVYSAGLAWGPDPNDFFFKQYLQLSQNPLELGGIRAPVFISTAVIWFLNWLIVFRGIGRGIEIANKIFMPILFVITTGLVIWALTLDGASEGIAAYLYPDFSKIAKLNVWIDAYSQIFFTLSLGFGIMVAYASYLPAKADLTRGAVLTGVINSMFSLMAGFGVFAVLGFMAHAKGLPVAKVVSQSIGLAFVAYPQAMSIMPGGQVFGIIFFASLVVAGLSSSISIIEAFAAAIMDKFALNRRFVVTALCILGFIGSAVFTTRAGLLWLDIVDHMLTHYGLVTVGLLECILGAWVFGIKKLRLHINAVSSIHLPRIWEHLIRFFIPVVLGLMLAGDIIADCKKPYGGYSCFAIVMIGLNWIVFTLIVAVVLTKRPWRYDYMLHLKEKQG